MSVVDLDDERSWPPAVLELATAEAQRLAGSTEYFTDLAVTELRDVASMMSGHTLRAFHATRLLDDEARAIQDGGLKVLSGDLVESRLRIARDAGVLSPEECEAIASENLLNDLEDRGRYRLGKVCFVAGREVFSHDLSGMTPLMGSWGGEAIYFAYDHRDPRAIRLKDIGRPAVVVAQLEITSDNVMDYQIDRLLRAFVGRLLGLEGVSAEIHYFADIPGERVENVLMPGNPSYADLGDLPTR